MKVLSNIQNNEDAVTKEYVDAKTGISAVDPTSGSIETDFFIPTKTSELTNDSGFITSAALTGKQDTLVSGTNIKTINNQSLLGSGNLTISGGTATDVQVNGTSITNNNIANLTTEGTYNSSTNKIATMSDINSFLTNYVPSTHSETSEYEGTINWGDYGLSTTVTNNNVTKDSSFSMQPSSLWLSVDDNNNQKSAYVWLQQDNGNQTITLKGDSVQLYPNYTPNSNDSLVNKKYVDDAIAAAITDALEASY